MRATGHGVRRGKISRALHQGNAPFRIVYRRLELSSAYEETREVTKTCPAADIRELQALTAPSDGARYVFLHDPSPKVRLAALLGCSTDALRLAFTRDSDPEIARTAVRLLTSYTSRALFVDTHNPQLRVADAREMTAAHGFSQVAYGTKVPPFLEGMTSQQDETKMRLLHHPSLGVQRSFIRSTHDLATVLQFVDSTSAILREEVLMRLTLDDERLRFAQDPSPAVRRRLAFVLDTDEARKLLSADPDPIVRQAVAIQLIDDTLRIPFLHDPSADVRLAAAESAQTDDVRLKCRHIEDVALQAVAIRNMGSDVLRARFLDGADIATKLLIVASMRTDAGRLLCRFDGSNEVRAAVVASVNDDQARLTCLTGTSDPGMIINLVRRFTKESSRWYVADHPEQTVRDAVVSGASTVELLSHFAHDAAVDVRMHAVERSWSDACRLPFAHDVERSIRQYVFDHLAEPEHQALFLDDPDPELRERAQREIAAYGMSIDMKHGYMNTHHQQGSPLREIGIAVSHTTAF